MRTLIWTLPTRIFHWLFTIGFATSYILGDFDELSNLHFAFGSFVGSLILFRMLFGLIGPKYSHFSDFPIGLNNQKKFIKNFFSKNTYIGHNPAAALIMLAILIIGLFCSISGYLLYAEENSVLSIIGNKDILEETHEISANIFLALVIIHLLGIFLDVILHRKTGTLTSIFKGYKNVESEKIELTGFQKAFSVLWLIIPFIFFYLAFDL